MLDVARSYYLVKSVLTKTPRVAILVVIPMISWVVSLCLLSGFCGTTTVAPGCNLGYCLKNKKDFIPLILWFW